MSQDNQGITANINHALSICNNLQSINPKIESTSLYLGNALVQIEEALNDLNAHHADTEVSQETLAWTEKRLDGIHDLARKHRTSVHNLPAITKKLKSQLAGIDNHAEDLKALQEKKQALEKDYQSQAKNLHKARSKSAKSLSLALSQSIQTLGMPEGLFQIQVKLSESDTPTANGPDQIEFLTQMNKGQPLVPFAKIASGGELSRISLAICVLIAAKLDTPTLIFDEVDVGIGGGTAQIVGSMLKALGEKAQIICITHLPQVASFGQLHLQVKKHIKDNATQISIKALSKEEKIQEIARMLGGLTITTTTLKHAKEMLSITE